MANMTDEELQHRRDQLAKGRETARLNRLNKGKPTEPSFVEAVEGLKAEVAAKPPAPPAEVKEPVTVPAVSASRAAALRAKYLADMPEDVAALFGDAELLEIEREEYDKALAEQKKQALADVRAQARQNARIEFDLIPADKLRSDAEKKRLRENVTFRMRLPGDGSGHTGQNGLRVDGRLYQDGHNYTVPRSVWESLVGNIYRAWKNQIEFETLNQHKRGGSAVEVLGRMMPDLEIRDAA